MTMTYRHMVGHNSTSARGFVSVWLLYPEEGQLMGRKTEMKHVSFRMPTEVHNDYVMVAESRGVDVSAILNWILIEYRPQALLMYARNAAAMLQARTVGLPQNLSAGPAPPEALRELEELIKLLKGVASKLSAQIGSVAKPAA
jgi:hypothetical protein